MADAPSYFVFDGDPGNGIAPRRPSTDDAGGDGKIDEASAPPDPETMPTAAAHNQRSRLLVGICKMLPVMRVSITFSGGVPSVAYFSAASEVLESGDLTINDNGVGDTSILWPADTFPPKSTAPGPVAINEDIAALEPNAIAVTNGVQVKTRNSAGTPTDMAFTVSVYGQ